jgi:hypothetical protein
MPTAALILLGRITPLTARADVVEPWTFGVASREVAEPWSFGTGMVGNSVVEPWSFGYFIGASVVEPWNFGVNVGTQVEEPWDFGSSGGARGGGGKLGSAPASPILGYRDRPT